MFFFSGLLLPKVVEDRGVKRTDAGNLGSGIYFSDSLRLVQRFLTPVAWARGQGDIMGACCGFPSAFPPLGQTDRAAGFLGTRACPAVGTGGVIFEIL